MKVLVDHNEGVYHFYKGVLGVHMLNRPTLPLTSSFDDLSV